MATSLPPSEQPPSGEKQNYNPEVWHLRFRGFCPSKRASPDQSLKQISELCYQWLRPDLNSKEEILDQLVLEQFMISMPPQLQALVKESGVTSCKDLEKMLRDHRKPRSWVSSAAQGKDSRGGGCGGLEAESTEGLALSGS